MRKKLGPMWRVLVNGLPYAEDMIKGRASAYKAAELLLALVKSGKITTVQRVVMQQRVGNNSWKDHEVLWGKK